MQHKRNGSEERKGKWGIEWKQSKGDTEYEKSRGQLDINSYFFAKNSNMTSNLNFKLLKREV